MTVIEIILFFFFIQIVNWLKHSPTEMEGYIRPGCLVLSMYLSMPAIAWEEVSLSPIGQQSWKYIIGISNVEPLM